MRSRISHIGRPPLTLISSTPNTTQHHTPTLYALSSVSRRCLSVEAVYADSVLSGELKQDKKQQYVVQQLATLQQQLVSYNPPFPRDDSKSPNSTSSSSSSSAGFPWFRKAASSSSSSSSSSNEERISLSQPKGLYIHGSPGSGKTFLMDLFYDDVKFRSKRRVHFNSFMLDVHQRIHEFRTSLSTRTNADADPIPPLSLSLRQEAMLLCLDEFQVLDIADAMTIRRLFRHLWQRGVVVVTTSNRPPEELYKNGLQRELFLPFIRDLKDCNHVLDMDSVVDYRVGGTLLKETYFYPVKQGRELFEHAWNRVAGSHPTESRTIPVMQGRSMHVLRASYGAARFSFDELCRRDVGAADYMAVCEVFDTVFLENIPILTWENRNELRRFILLIDELYNNSVRLVCLAEAPPTELLKKGDSESFDELFAFDRCASRLMEMQSKEYLEKAFASNKKP